MCSQNQRDTVDNMTREFSFSAIDWICEQYSIDAGKMYVGIGIFFPWKFYSSTVNVTGKCDAPKQTLVKQAGKVHSPPLVQRTSARPLA